MSGRGRPRTEPGSYGVVKETALVGGGWRFTATLRLNNGTTKSISGSGRTKPVAATALDQAKVEALGTVSTAAVSGTTTISALGALWLAEFRKKDRAVQTTQRYEATPKGVIERKLGALTIRELSNADIRQFVLVIAETGHLAEARCARTVIRGVLGYAILRGAAPASLIDFNGFELAVPRKAPKAIQQADLERLREFIVADMLRLRSGGPKSRKAHDDLLDVIDLILATSARISEVLAIARDAVDFEAGTVHISRKVEYVASVRKNEVTETPGHYRLANAKTNGTVRTILIPDYALDILSERFEDGRTQAFSNNKGGLLSQNNVRRTLRAITAGTEFEWFTPHIGRKTVATVVNNEMGSAVAADVLGHEGDQLIITTYGEKRKLAPDVREITTRFGRAKRPSDWSGEAQ